jgi:hypothetical protein
MGDYSFELFWILSMHIGVHLEGASSSPNAKMSGAAETPETSKKGEIFRQNYLGQKHSAENGAAEAVEPDFQVVPITLPEQAQTPKQNPKAETANPPVDTREADIGLNRPEGRGETRHKGKTDQNIAPDPTPDAGIDGPKTEKSKTVFTPISDLAAAVNSANNAASITQPSTSVTAAASTVSAPASSFNQIVSDMQQTSPQQPIAKLQIDTNTASKISQMVSAISQSEGDQKSRVYVQLDPPELGRLALDFKFDPQGLQQIIITSETQEALKRMRGQHFELVQALQENGMGESAVSYQQSQDNRGKSHLHYDGDEHKQNDTITAVSPPIVTHTYHPNMREKLIANNSLNIII